MPHWIWPVLLLIVLALGGLVIWWRHHLLHRKAIEGLKAEFPETREALLCAVVVGGKRAPAVAALLPDRILVQQPAVDETVLHMPHDCFSCEESAEPSDGRSSMGLRVLTFEAAQYKIDLLLPRHVAAVWLPCIRGEDSAKD